MTERLWMPFLSFLFLCLSFSCSDGLSGRVVKPDVVEKGDTAYRTLLIYMVAENSLHNYAAYDIAEIVEASVDVPRDCRLFVYVDDNSFPIMHQYFRCTDGSAGNLTFHPFSKDVCSSDTAALGSLLDYILENYPTRKLDLVLWSHGDGWLRGPESAAPQRSVGIDNGKNSYSNDATKAIEMEELAALLERLPVKVDRLMFDACFMQCVEVVYALRDAVEWIVASPAEIPGHGAGYATVLQAFFLSDGPMDIIDLYLKGYETEFAGAVLSAVRPAASVQLADATAYYVEKYFNSGKNREYDDVFAYLPGGKYSASKPYPSYFDMNSVMLKYLTADEYAQWRKALDSVVVFSASSPRWYSAVCGRTLGYNIFEGCGMSMYMPQNSFLSQDFNESFRTTEWYDAAGWSSAGW